MAFKMFGLSAVLACLMVSFVTANWDPATGHVRDYTVSAEWLAKNKPTVVTKEIQVSECAKNTRLRYPNVQLFAMFTVNHDEDHYHGCPYGDCWAFTVFPSAKDLVPSYTDNHLFFWHKTGGVDSDGTKPISDPQTGAYGYEESITGKFKSGSMNTASLQLNHDSKYPGFNEDKLQLWTQEERDQFKDYQNSQPLQPKCGRPCEPNKDPGSNPDTYGGYVPALAQKYTPPPSWIPGTRDQCFANNTGYHAGGSGIVPQPLPGSGGSGDQPAPGSGGSGDQPAPGSGGSVKPLPGSSGTEQKPAPGSQGSDKPVPGSSGSANKGIPGSSGSQTQQGAHASSRNNCKSFCRCLKNCDDEDCNSQCQSKKKTGCSEASCSTSSARFKKCS